MTILDPLHTVGWGNCEAQMRNAPPPPPFAAYPLHCPHSLPPSPQYLHTVGMGHCEVRMMTASPARSSCRPLPSNEHHISERVSAGTCREWGCRAEVMVPPP